MTDWLALDRFAIEAAERLAASQPRCDYTFEQLPLAAVVDPTDLFCLERNGINYAAPASLIPDDHHRFDWLLQRRNVWCARRRNDGQRFVLQRDLSGCVSQRRHHLRPARALQSFHRLYLGVAYGRIAYGCWSRVRLHRHGGGKRSGKRHLNGWLGKLHLDFRHRVHWEHHEPSPSAQRSWRRRIQRRRPEPDIQLLLRWNTGNCVNFLGVNGGEAHSNYFYGTGYNGAGSSNTLPTPAIYMDCACFAVKAHHNDFQAVKYFGILILGTDCEASFNYLKSSGNAAIRVGQVSSSGLGNNARVCYNRVDTVLQNPIDSAGGSGIYAEGVVGGEYNGNVVSTTDSDGMVFASCGQFTCISNVVYNCCQQGNDCGIQYNPQAGGPNIGAVIVGNVSFDNQGSPTQLNGLRVLGPGSGGATYTVISGNSFNGFTRTISATPQRGINATDAVLDDDTNIIEGNTDWLDRQHLGSASTTVGASVTATAVGAPSGSVLGTQNVEKGVMGLNRAIHLTAYGVATITTSVTYLLSFGGTLGNVVSFAETTTGTAQPWRLEMWLNSGDNNNVQHFSYVLYYHGILVASGGGNLAVDTTMDNPLTLQATTLTGDSITCTGYTYTRE